MADIAQEELQRAGYDLQMVEIETQTETAKEAVGSGFGLSLWAETEGGCIISGSSIGERAKRAEEVGKEAADELIANLAHGGCTDEYLQDQIIIFMALAEGKSTVVTGPLSLHTRTAIWVAETMTEARFSTTEDISQLSLSPQSQTARDYDFSNDQHQHKTFHYSTSPPNQNPNPQFQFAPASLGQQSAKKPVRAGLPSQWLDSNQQQSLPENRALSPPHTSDLSSGGGSPPPPQIPQIQQPQLYGQQTPPTAPSNASGEDDIIPNAIVIKNIPFTVKRETLLDIIASLNIPTPYAFNYHIDTNGQFRGLAFANFRAAADADAVVVALNGFDVQGRKLRVEYKKVLLAGEKERIEREKALRRMRSMQLEKEREAMNRAVSAGPIPSQDWDTFGPVHPMPMPNTIGADIGPLGGTGVSTISAPLLQGMPAPNTSAQRNYSQPGIGISTQQPSLNLPQISSLITQPTVTQTYPPSPPLSGTSTKASSAASELDLNDPSTLEIYSRILVFKEDRMRDELAFSRTLTPKQRRIVHLVAQRLGVYHYSVGEGEERYAVVTRIPREEASRQPVRHTPQTLHRSPSAYLNPPAGPVHSQSHNAVSHSQSQGLAAASGLRYKKSMPDLNSLHAGAPRLQTRASNSNIREGYATIGTSPRRTRTDGFGGLFTNGSGNGNGINGSDIPPVPALPTIPSLNTEIGVVRQPRGPGVGGFAARRPTDSRPIGTNAPGLDTRSSEPLEL
ncbi:hypothetical protein FRB99_006356 [Tulasnella sp. 403]|nr:hypothetical protein FRB99_006356 [Tulasnella sp. 403]